MTAASSPSTSDREPVPFCRMIAARFTLRVSVQQVEEGTDLAPRFDECGLLPVVTTDAATGDVLMMGAMNAEALRLTITSGEAHYWSRSRQALWRKGATSGLVQRVVEMRIDDDQDAVWLRVNVQGNGASCHVGYRSCFYRSIRTREDGSVELVFQELKKKFDPILVYGNAPNPTQV